METCLEGNHQVLVLSHHNLVIIPVEAHLHSEHLLEANQHLELPLLVVFSVIVRPLLHQDHFLGQMQMRAKEDHFLVNQLNLEMEEIFLESLQNQVKVPSLVNHQLVAHYLVSQVACSETLQRICFLRKQMIQLSKIKVMVERMNFIKMKTMKHQLSLLVKT